MPSSTPCSATARMTRADPAGAQRDEVDQQQSRRPAARRAASSSASPHAAGRGQSRQQARRRPAACGTCGSRSRAMIDSTTPDADRHAEHPADEERPVRASARPAAARRPARATSSAPKHEQLERRAVEDHAEGRAAVVEHHDLVDHRQLEVRVRDRRPGCGSSRPAGRRTARPRPGPARRRPLEPARRRRRAAACPSRLQRAGQPGQHEQARGTAPARPGRRRSTSRAAPMPSKARAGVERRRGREEPAQAEQVGEQDRGRRRTRSGAGERPSGTSSPAEQRRHQRRPPARPRNTQVVVVLKTDALARAA